MDNDKKTIKEIFNQIMEILKRESVSSVEKISKELNSNWKTIDDYCSILENLNIVTIKIFAKHKLVIKK